MVDVADADVADLATRLAHTRWAPEPAGAGWTYGTSGAYLRELVTYWLDGYDWRAHEAAMNVHRHFRVDLDGVDVHYLHAPGRGPAPLPLILTHGWPWTFWDFAKVIGPLSDPAAHGGDPADAFDVVVPSLPGYGFSTPLERVGVGVAEIAALWTRLMTDVLGFDRFAAHGGDWGSAVTAQLGHAHADHVLGAHVSLTMPANIASASADRSEYAPEEAGWYERTRSFQRSGMGYFAVQSTVPQTVAHAMNDSPAGLAAWLVEKRRAWSDCDGDVERVFSKDDLLTSVSLFWHTASYGSAARLYYEGVHQRPVALDDAMPVVRVPTAVMVSPRDVMLLPRAWAERYYDLQRWTVLPAGGHFAPMEQPDALVDDLRTFFRGLR